MNAPKIKNAAIKILSNSPLGARGFFLSLSTLFSFTFFAFRLEYINFDYTKIQSVHDLCFYRGTQTFFF